MCSLCATNGLITSGRPSSATASRVWWAGDRKWYPGEVTEAAAGRVHLSRKWNEGGTLLDNFVQYDDGETKWHSLWHVGEKWEVLKPPSGGVALSRPAAVAYEMCGINLRLSAPERARRRVRHRERKGSPLQRPVARGCCVGQAGGEGRNKGGGASGSGGDGGAESAEAGAGKPEAGTRSQAQ